ncbi:multidrug effflux MFS transporter [Alisedimentitalea sp. MJ-SS2]|uniref:multidrug effflux MFS transporter n=1 Tax=Aliisedimentitalea sp. MJ-SS2 TaxID=3049795 RepID=UPI002906532D|nr:multidrug effflux MFS transporter [Alisedimentitalea sp. MJ-SS2]MDU8926573.1 multidrug effflux MFS transporter [Alisedimentitalea sp. MJ-SS2]
MAPAKSPPKMLTLVLLTSLSVLSLNMFLPSLKQIAAEYGVEYGVVSLALGGYLAMSALLQMILGPLSDMIGRRPVMLAGIGVFAIASVGCALAENVWVFLGFRMVQCLVGVGMVLSRAVVRDIAPKEEAARLLGIMGTAMALAPLLGPVFGGYLDEWLGWRSTFWFFAVGGVALLVLTWVDMGETNQNPSDSFGAQFRSYPELFRERLFWAYCVLLVFSVGGFYVFLGGAPQVGEEAYGLTPGLLGLGMGSISGGFMLGNIISTRMTRSWGIVKLMTLGRIVGTVGPLVALLLTLAGLSHPFVMFGGAIFIGFGNGLTLPGANAGVMSVAPHLAGSASGLSGALTLAGGAAISTLVGALVAGSFGVYVLLTAMVITSAIGLAAAIYVGRLEAQRPEL